MTARAGARPAVLAAGRLLGLVIATAAGRRSWWRRRRCPWWRPPRSPRPGRLGWPPRRLYRAALWCLPMLAVWLAATGGRRPVLRGRWPPRRTTPGCDVARWSRPGQCRGRAVTVAPAAVPLGLLVGGLAWACRILPMETGTGGLSPGPAIGFDRRQWRHQVRSAAGPDRRAGRGAADCAVTATW